MGSNIREKSKENFRIGGLVPTENELKVGALQRIADATEKMAESSQAMAKNYNDLLRERNMFKDWYRDEQNKVEKLKRSNAALRGVITRLKNKGAR